MPRRLAVITTHPIQYYAPVFRAIAAHDDIELRVFYTLSQSRDSARVDPGFGHAVQWDIPLLEGYAHQFVPNIAKHPGTEAFNGLHNPSLIREVETWGADAVLIYTWNSRTHLQAMRHFKQRIPVFFRGDSTLLDRRPAWRTYLRRRVLSWVYTHIDVAIAVGSNNRDYFEWCGVPPIKIALAAHSIDVRRFEMTDARYAEHAAAWRTRFGIGRSDVVFLFAGKFQRKKSPQLLLDAFAALKEHAHLVFVGNGELEEELVIGARASERVHFLPFQNQSLMPAVYRLGDVFVLPSQGPEETWGLAVNEAMASGRPVIASDKVGCARDVIQEGVNGWSFNAGSREQLEQLLRQAVLKGQGYLHGLGRNAQSLSSQWTSEQSARRIVETVLGNS